MAEKPRKKWKLVLAGVIALLIMMAVVAHVPTGPVKIIISPETTVILGPLNPDGTVNYLAALEAELSEGVTPENNAAVLLVKAIGPSMLPHPGRYKALEQLGLRAEDIASDSYFVSWHERASLMKETIVKDTDGRRLHVEEMLDKGQVHPDLEAWLEANAGPLRMVERASRLPRYYIPMVAKSHPPVLIQTLVSEVGWPRDLARALFYRAAFRRNSGDVDGAWEDVLTVHRLARLMQQGPTLFQQLIASAIESMAAHAGIELATRERLTPEKAKRLLDDLAALEPAGNVVDSIDRYERLAFLDMVMMLSRGQQLPDWPRRERWLRTSGLDWNEMLRGANRWFDRYVGSMRVPKFQDRLKAQAAFKADFARRASPAKSKDRIAKRILLGLGGRPCRQALTREVTDVLIAELIPAPFGVQEIQEQVRTTSDIERIAITLAWFKAETGRYPAKLAELTPRYLPTIPADRFSPDPLIYRAKDGGYIVYSVGVNLTDDGGDWTGKKDDIAAEAKPAEP